MKTSSILAVAVLGTANLAVAQFPEGFPECGVTCINNMLGKASEFNCNANDAKCLCVNQDFIWGVRDCSNQACQNQGSAATVQDYGAQYCAGAQVSITYDSTATGAQATTTGEASATGSISSFSTVITSDGSTLTSTGETTVGTGSASESLTTYTSNGTTSTSTIESPSATSDGGATASTTGTVPSETSATENFGAQITTPAGLLAAAGMAVLLL